MRPEMLATYRTEPLLVLALWQPWAILCVAPDPAHGGQPAKEHETRHWAPFDQLPIRVVVHAAKRYDKENRDHFTEPRFAAALQRAGYYAGDPRPFLDRKALAPGVRRPVPLGAIVGLATIDRVLPTWPSTGDMFKAVEPIDVASLSDDDRAFGNFAPHRFAWHLTGTVLLPEPVPFSARQEPLYALDGRARELVDAQLDVMLGQNTSDGDASRVVLGQGVA